MSKIVKPIFARMQAVPLCRYIVLHTFFHLSHSKKDVVLFTALLCLQYKRSHAMHQQITQILYITLIYIQYDTEARHIQNEYRPSLLGDIIAYRY